MKCECCGRPIGPGIIRTARYKAGLTIFQAAELLGTTYQSLYRWELTDEIPPNKRDEVMRTIARWPKRR